MLVILFSFPYDIYITLYVTEFLIFSEMRYSELRKWLKNLTRAVVILLSLTVSTIFYDKLPQITGWPRRNSNWRACSDDYTCIA